MLVKLVHPPKANFPKFGHTIRNIDTGKTGASPKGILRNLRDAIWNLDGCQSRTMLKYAIPKFCDTIGNLNASKP